MRIIQGWGRNRKKEPPPQPAIIVICFKCGDKGHKSKECAKKLDICSIPSCQSQSHNVEGHKVMLKVGRVVQSGNKEIRAVDTGLAKKATEISNEALAQKQQKRKEKNKRKTEKRKLARSLLTQLSNESCLQATSQSSLPPHPLTLMAFIVALWPLTINPISLALILHYLSTGHPVLNNSGPRDLQCKTLGVLYNPPFSSQPVW